MCHHGGGIICLKRPQVQILQLTVSTRSQFFGFFLQVWTFYPYILESGFIFLFTEFKSEHCMNLQVRFINLQDGFLAALKQF